ncbi:MAG: diguanylate cyclase [Betaproteobacteria bacterium]|nr:diguanylate cyclase [Betaproteobacteria bacterium]
MSLGKLLCAHAASGLLLFACGLALAAPTPPPASPGGTASPVELPDFKDLSLAALSQLRVDGWQTEQGLPLNTVQSVYQTKSGHLWVGTAGGLARFDGLRFTTFEPPELQELAGRPVFGFMEDSEGALWIGNFNSALRWRNGRFERVFGPEVTERRRVWAFAEEKGSVGKTGTIWAATENGLVRWRAGGADGKADIKIYKVADGLPTLRLRSLAFDRQGTLWIATSGGGLVAFAGEKFTVYSTANGLPHHEVRHVVADPRGGIWAATAGGGLVRMIDGQMRVFTTRDGLPTDHLTALALGRRGELWIGTWGAGVARLRDGKFSTMNAAGGLAGDQIWSILVDREDSVWVGTWVGGLNRLRERAFFPLGKSEGLTHDNARSILHAKDGAVWIALAGGGVNRIANGQVSAIGLREGLPSLEASALLEDRDGSIWIGTYTEGAARWRPGAGRIERFGKPRGMASADVRAFFQDRSGAVWMGTKSGLARFDGRVFVPVKDEGAPSEGVAAIAEDRAGNLWFGTTGSGLVRFADGRFTTFTRNDGLVSNWIVSLHVDAGDALWIGTVGEGLNRLKAGKFASVRTADGLWDGVVQTIIEDKSGHFWISCNRGFYRVARAELDAFIEGRAERVTSRAFGPGDALRSTTFAGGVQPAGAIDASGHVWLPSFNGLVIIDPARLPGAGEPPEVVLEDVLVHDKPVSADAGVSLPPGSAPLAVRYFARTLNQAERVQFRYRMDGLTRDWVLVGRNREATFPALPHGRYELQVAASLDGTRWSEPSPPVRVTVTPFFWQTAWFIALALLGAAFALFGLYRLRTRQLQRRHDEMEQLVAEKTEALRLANEHLSRLSFIDALTGLANRRRMDETLETEWRRAERAGLPLAIVMADIDYFKAYNDSLGHPVGDKCLIKVAEVIATAAGRAGDLAARYGGEEFVVLMPGADHAAATAFAERVRAACEASAIPHPASPAGKFVTVSLGVAAVKPSAGSSVAEVMALADAALYRAKQDGRNRVR